LFRGQRQGVTFPLADALCWLLASRFQILDVMELLRASRDDPAQAELMSGYVNFFTDLCHLQAAAAAGEAARICADLVYGYNRHPAWDDGTCGGCYNPVELESLEALIPGISGVAPAYTDVVDEAVVRRKAGPCVRFDGYEEFVRRRTKLDGCLTGSRLAKDRAAAALASVMIPEVLDYPL
jgi:hypothetical protein